MYEFPRSYAKDRLTFPRHSGDKDAVLKELMSEGVARIGVVSEEWLRSCEAFCAGRKFDNVLSLGAARREVLP